MNTITARNIQCIETLDNSTKHQTKIVDKPILQYTFIEFVNLH